MKYRIGLIIALFFMVIVQSAFAGLNALMDRNVKDSSKSYDKVIGTKQGEQTLLLWVHVRSKDQEKAVRNALGWLKSIELGGKKLELRPIQLVTSGPQDSQLRFFKKQDESNAKQLLIKLKERIPLLQLENLSHQYGGIDWIKPGHYELWLAPDLKKLNTP